MYVCLAEKEEKVTDGEEGELRKKKKISLFLMSVLLQQQLQQWEEEEEEEEEFKVQRVNLFQLSLWFIYSCCD